MPRGGVEEEQFSLLSPRINDVILPNMCDRWIWSLDASGFFSVKSTHHLIDDTLLPKVDVPALWVMVIPIKVNIHAWRLVKSEAKLCAGGRSKIPLSMGMVSGLIGSNKMHKAFPLPVIEFPLPEEVLTASEESCHCQKKKEATAVKIAL
nr:RNA-directed DNA polymerase, eukaryota [Tanacetum cinerariifolium]